MNVKITPTRLSGNISAISSKSDVHRLLIASALADFPTSIRINGLSLDIKATIGCLTALGAKISVSCDLDEHTLYVTPIKSTPCSPVLNCGESGSTARFILPIAACVCDNFTLIGEGGLPGRPFSPLCSQMEQNRCCFDSHTLPMKVSNRLHEGDFALMGNVSSQYITGLLLALPLLSGDSKIELLSPLESKNYVDMTLSTLKTFGISVKYDDSGFYIKGEQKYTSPRQAIADGDWSNSAFWLACPQVSVSGLDPESLQGDKAIATLVQQLQGKTQDLTIDATQIPDLVPILATIAATAQGKTSIVNAGRLRLKESDRLHSVSTTLAQIGANIHIVGDGLEIIGKPSLNGGTADSFNDHRIAMSLAIASCHCINPLIITNAEAVNKSYPDFFSDFNNLGGNANVI